MQGLFSKTKPSVCPHTDPGWFHIALHDRRREDTASAVLYAIGVSSHGFTSALTKPLTTDAVMTVVRLVRAAPELVVGLQLGLRLGVEDVVTARLRGVLDLVLAVGDHHVAGLGHVGALDGHVLLGAQRPRVDDGPAGVASLVVEDVADGAHLLVVVVENVVAGEVGGLAGRLALGITGEGGHR